MAIRFYWLLAPIRDILFGVEIPSHYYTVDLCLGDRIYRSKELRIYTNKSGLCSVEFVSIRLSI